MCSSLFCQEFNVEHVREQQLTVDISCVELAHADLSNFQSSQTFCISCVCAFGVAGMAGLEAAGVLGQVAANGTAGERTSRALDTLRGVCASQLRAKVGAS
jgi:hypothetical protein